MVSALDLLILVLRWLFPPYFRLYFSLLNLCYIFVLFLLAYYHFWKRNEVWVRFTFVRELLQGISLPLYIQFVPIFLKTLICFHCAIFLWSFFSYYITCFSYHIYFTSIIMKTTHICESNDILLRFCLCIIFMKLYICNQNIQHFQKSMQIFMLAEVFSSYCYLSKIIFENIGTVQWQLNFIQYSTLATIFIFYFIVDIQC